MDTELKSFAWAALPLALCMALVPAAAQTPREQAEKELARKVPAGSVQACSLITRADVKQATGRDPYVDPEPAGQGGWICNVGIGELKVYSGPKSWEAWESTLKAFKKDQAPQTPARASVSARTLSTRSRTTSIKATSRSWSRSRATRRSRFRSTRPRASQPSRCARRSNR